MKYKRLIRRIVKDNVKEIQIEKRKEKKKLIKGKKVNRQQKMMRSLGKW